MRHLHDLIALSRHRRSAMVQRGPAPLQSGRLDTPEPQDDVWVDIGPPGHVDLHSLNLHPDALATARSAFVWSQAYCHENAPPVSVAEVDGVLHVLDGYERIVQAHRDRRSSIVIQRKR